MNTILQIKFANYKKGDFMESKEWGAKKIALWCIATAFALLTVYNSYLLGIVAEPPNYKKLLGSVLMISGPLIGCLLSKWKSERAKLRVPVAVILICIVINFLILK